MNFNQIVILVSSISGGGKTTIIYKALEELTNFEKAITCTTRPPRDKEVDNVDYYFMTDNEFEAKIKKNFFIEHSSVYGNFYGTSKAELQRIANNKKHCILVVDVQGYRNITNAKIPNLHSVFIAPPSIELAMDRLRARKSETPEALVRRELMMQDEMASAKLFDHTIINSNLEVATKDFINLAKNLLKKS